MSSGPITAAIAITYSYFFDNLADQIVGMSKIRNTLPSDNDPSTSSLSISNVQAWYETQNKMRRRAEF